MLSTGGGAGGALAGLVGATRSGGGGGAGFGTSAALGTAAELMSGFCVKAAFGLVAVATMGACPGSSEDVAVVEPRSAGFAETALFRSLGERDRLPRGSRGGRSLPWRQRS